MNTTLAQCRYLLSLAKPILDGLDDSHRALEPQPGSKTAGWLIGHLAVSGDFARRLCGRPPLCPADWGAAFNPGSQPSREANDYPSMATLRDTFESVYSDLSGAASEADPSSLTSINPYAPARAAFPTAGGFLADFLSGPPASPPGQLRAVRAAVRPRPLPPPDAPA